MSDSEINYLRRPQENYPDGSFLLEYRGAETDRIIKRVIREER